MRIISCALFGSVRACVRALRSLRPPVRRFCVEIFSQSVSCQAFRTERFASSVSHRTFRAERLPWYHMNPFTTARTLFGGKLLGNGVGYFYSMTGEHSDEDQNRVVNVGVSIFFCYVYRWS
ncbi:unnamed protein product [Laminaria digitata]